MSIQSFTDLEVWKKARLLRKSISTLTHKFPADEKFKLTDQIKRSSRSITANIAEGYGRFHYQENIQFCRIARGSLTETLDHLIVAYDEEYIDEQTLKEFESQLTEVKKILNGYIKYLAKAKQLPMGTDETPSDN
ncbi:MAG: four helix bundle protein [Roseivirga sp.]|jgi:four helix bundle protein